MKLQEFKKILCSVVDSVHHMQAHKETGNYIVWHEYGKGKVGGNTFWRIQIDYYTTAEYDETADKIIKILNACDEIAAKEPVIDYDSDAKKWRYIIQCEVAE